MRSYFILKLLFQSIARSRDCSCKRMNCLPHNAARKIAVVGVDLQRFEATLGLLTLRYADRYRPDRRSRMTCFAQRKNDRARGPHLVPRNLREVGILDLVDSVHCEVGVMNQEWQSLI